MRVDEFDFELPEERIALRPANPRDASRLLVVSADGSLHHESVRNLPDHLDCGDVLVMNDTRVIPARLFGRREARDETAQGAKVEVLLHRRISDSRFKAFARPAKRLQAGDNITFGASLNAIVENKAEGGEVEIVFDQGGSRLDAVLAAEGEIPLPPYIAWKRKADAHDLEDYQTIFARENGSVAAPTAGLHFTPDLFSRLDGKGVERQTLTLHVGAGTFLPVNVDDTSAHKMHSERAALSQEAADALNAARARGARIAAVGTTALRTLETAADDSGRFHAFEGETALFITPGYRFKAVDVLLTNFHTPRSTLFMLVCAFLGTDVMKHAYAEAIAQSYRFYSYGDACLLKRS